jgi:hypothetical protein
MVVRFAEVGAHPRSQLLGFADVQNMIGRIPHKVNARFRGNFFEAGFQAIGIFEQGLGFGSRRRHRWGAVGKTVDWLFLGYRDTGDLESPPAKAPLRWGIP